MGTTADKDQRGRARKQCKHRDPVTLDGHPVSPEVHSPRLGADISRPSLCLAAGANQPQLILNLKASSRSIDCFNGLPNNSSPLVLLFARCVACSAILVAARRGSPLPRE
jgi:hypothetical protein